MDKKDKDTDRNESASQSAGTEDADIPKWGEMLKRVVSVGLGAAFMTEESVRNALGGINLPKEVISSILQGANRSKEDFLNKVGNETIKLISKIDFVKEASRFVEDHKFRINAEIEVVRKEPSSGESSFSLNTKVKVKD